MEQYLAPTPDAFLRWLRLLKCDRVYRSPIYDRYFDILLNLPRRLLSMMPRGSFKSTILCSLAARDIVLNPNIRLLYASETYANSKKYLGWIRRQFEANDDLRRIFGDFVPDRGWKEEELTVRGRTNLATKEPTLSCAGLDVTKVGMHYDKIYVDDPVSLANCRTREGLKGVIDWYQMLLSIAEDVVDEAGQLVSSTAVILNGTPYEDDDVYGWVQRMNEELVKRAQAGEPGITPYVIFKEPAEDAEGNPTFRHMPRPVLEQYKIEKKMRAYSSQYLLNPVPSEFATFKRPQFKVIPVHEIPPRIDLAIYLLTDTATSEDREDDTVLSVLGKDFINNAYVLDMAVGQWGPADVIKNIASLYTKWSCKAMAMEKIAINEIYGAMLQALSIETQTRFNIIPVFGRTTESKSMRIESLQGRFEAGKIFFSSALDPELIHVEQGLAYGKIVEQFVRFAAHTRKHDDIPDCLSDMDKQDSRGSYLFPAPRMVRRAAPKPATINGRYAVAPKPGQPAANFWGNLAQQTGRK